MKRKRIDCLSCTAANLQRREFLRVGSLSLLGISFSQYLSFQNLMASQQHGKAKAKAEACILLWLEGGPSHVDTWDPKPNSAFRPISTNVAGIQISELLPKLSKHMDKLSIIRSMHTQGLDHPQATQYALTGHKSNPAMQFPSLGSIITKETGSRNNVLPHVLVPQWETSRQIEDYFKANVIGAEYDPMVIPDPTRKDFRVADLSLPKSLSAECIENRRSFLKVVDQVYRENVESAEHTNVDSFTDQALKMLLTPSVREAFDLAKESEKTRDTYGRDRVGQSLLLARRLVEAGSRFVTAAGFHDNAWDTHGNNDKEHRDKLTPLLDRALSALLVDLEQRGLLESTIVLAMGEFGRTPDLNRDVGRDHWPFCWSLALGGGGLRAGQIIGASDERGAQVGERAVSIGDLFATIYKAFGINWEKEYMTPVGRPIKIANSLEDRTGEPIVELI